METGQRYSITRLLEILRKAECSHIHQNYYLFDHYDDVLDSIGKGLNMDFSKQILSLGDIKKILGNTKR